MSQKKPVKCTVFIPEDYVMAEYIEKVMEAHGGKCTGSESFSVKMTKAEANELLKKTFGLFSEEFEVVD